MDFEFLLKTKPAPIELKAAIESASVTRSAAVEPVTIIEFRLVVSQPNLSKKSRELKQSK